jgi:hypothetical protein
MSCDFQINGLRKEEGNEGRTEGRKETKKKKKKKKKTIKRVKILLEVFSLGYFFLLPFCVVLMSLISYFILA